MAETHPNCIRVGRVCDQLFIQAAGQCTFTACPAIDAFVQQLCRPGTADIFLDLSQADAIDSTFAGFVVGLAKRSRNPAEPALHLLRPTPAARDALRRMNILRMLDLRDESPAAPTEWRTIDRGDCDRDALRAMVRGAHEQLIEADPRNAAEFDGVVRRMTEERPDST